MKKLSLLLPMLLLFAGGCITNKIAPKKSFASSIGSSGAVPSEVFGMQKTSGEARIYMTRSRSLPADQERDMTKNEQIMGALASGNTEAAVAAIQSTAKSALNSVTGNTTQVDEYFYEGPFPTNDIVSTSMVAFQNADSAGRNTTIETSVIDRKVDNQSEAIDELKRQLDATQRALVSVSQEVQRVGDQATAAANHQHDVGGEEDKIVLRPEGGDTAAPVALAPQSAHWIGGNPAAFYVPRQWGGATIQADRTRFDFGIGGAVEGLTPIEILGFWRYAVPVRDGELVITLYSDGSDESLANIGMQDIDAGIQSKSVDRPLEAGGKWTGPKGTL